MKSITFLSSFMIIGIMLCLPVAMMAQGNPGGDPDVPVDGGVGLLIAAGVAYGAKKARDMRKAKKSKSTENLS